MMFSLKDKLETSSLQKKALQREVLIETNSKCRLNIKSELFNIKLSLGNTVNMRMKKRIPFERHITMLTEFKTSFYSGVSFQIIPIFLAVRNSRVTKSSYEIEFCKMTSQLELLTRTFL